MPNTNLVKVLNKALEKNKARIDKYNNWIKEIQLENKTIEEAIKTQGGD